MTAAQILNAYPHCQVAVAYCELILDGKDDDDDIPETCFEMMRRAVPPMSIDEVYACIKESMQDETACKAPEALQQMDHPEFMAYLKAKMGML